MKIACITDTHFSFKRSNKIFHNFFEKFYTDIFFPTLNERKINSVIHLGDAFDNRKGVDYWGLEWAQRVFYDKLRDNDIRVYQIGGNHDCAYKDTNKVNSIDTLLRDYPNIISITEPKEIKIDNTKILMLPWICKDNEKQVFELIEKTTSKLLFGHLELQGFTLFPGMVQTHGMTTEKFYKFDKVFSGHYHTRSSDGRVFYLGNPYQMFWSDVEDTRGFHIFDTETYELEFIKNPYSIFHKINYENTDIQTFDFSILNEKFIKVVVKQKDNQFEYDKFIQKILNQNIFDLKIVEIVDNLSINSNLEELDGEDTLQTLNKYLEALDFNLDKTIIKKILQDTYKEALEMELI